MRLVLVLVLGSAAACAWTQAPPLAEGTVVSQVAEGTAPSLFLAPGDRISVQVFMHPESSTPEQGARLDAEGRLDLPLIGPIALAGLTPAEARAHLTAELGRFLRAPEVSLNVIELGSRRVFIFGEMERPGGYPLERPLTALQALTMAGGFRPGADREHVALLRGTKDALQVYFFNGATPGVDGLVFVQPDDFLFVRLSGAGTFRDQLLPIVQSIVPPITGLASLVVVADQLNE
jgi:protein involved in polysaccharide export with SLBB domain